MAHDIWQDNMAYVGEVPWHGLGKKVDSWIDGPELKEVINLSPVGLRPLYAYDPENGGKYIPVHTHNAVIRERDGLTVGIVGNGFRPIQDTEVVDTLDVLRAEGLLRFHTAGLLRGGSRFFVCCDVPNGVLRLKTPNGGEDVVVNYLVASHGHDGSLAFEFSPTTVRVVCQNTVNMARQEARNNRVAFYIKHTENSANRVKAAVAAYRKVIEFTDEVAKKAQQLIQTPFSDKQMVELADTVWPIKPGTDDIPAQTLKARYDAVQLFHTGKGHQDLAITGTAWGAFNAIVEYLDYHRPTRGLKDATDAERTSRRVEAAWFAGPVYDKKLLALNAIEKIAA